MAGTAALHVAAGFGAPAQIVAQLAALQARVDAAEARADAAEALAVAAELRVAPTIARARAGRARARVVEARAQGALTHLAFRRREMNAAFEALPPEEYATLQGLRVAHRSVSVVNAGFWAAHNTMCDVEVILDLEVRAPEDEDAEDSEDDEDDDI